MALAQWACFATVARIGGAGPAGQLALATAVVTPVLLASWGGLRIQVATNDNLRPLWRDALSLRMVLGSIGILIAGVLSLLAGSSFAPWHLVAVVAIAKAIEGMSDVIYGFLQRLGHITAIGKSLLMRAILTFGIFAAVYAGTHQLALALISVILVNALMVVIVDAKKSPVPVGAAFSQIHRMTWDPVERKALVQIARISLPLGFATVLHALNFYIPRYFLQSYSGPEGVATLVSVVYIVAVGELVVRSANQARSRQLAEAVAIRDSSTVIRVLINGLTFAFLAGIVGVLGGVAIGPELLNWVYGSHMEIKTELVLVVMIAGGNLYLVSVFGYLLSAMAMNWMQTMLIAASCLVNILACGLLVPEHGALGGGFAWAVALGVHSIGISIAAIVGIRRLTRAPNVS